MTFVLAFIVLGLLFLLYVGFLKLSSRVLISVFGRRRSTRPGIPAQTPCPGSGVNFASPYPLRPQTYSPVSVACHVCGWVGPASPTGFVELHYRD